MFCFSMKITHPKVFIFRNWESFGNICIRSQSLLLAKAGEVVWVATFELQLNRDFKQRQNRPMQHHKSRWSIPSVVLQSFFSENLSSHLKKKIPRESRSIPVTLSKVAFFEAFPLCLCGHIERFGTHWLFLQLSITCDVNFTYNPNVKPLKACRTCKKKPYHFDKLGQPFVSLLKAVKGPNLMKWCRGPQVSSENKYFVWSVLESQTALPWNWGWRPCLRNTLRGQGDIACQNFQSCHSWSAHLVSPACRSQSRNVKLF